MKHSLPITSLDSHSTNKLGATELDAHLTEREANLQRWEVIFTKAS
jgi:hypothetical protein